MGVIIGGVVTLFALLLFIWATYKHGMENRRLRPQQYLHPDQAGARQKSTTMKKLSLCAQIASAVLGAGSLIATIVFGVLALKSKS